KSLISIQILKLAWRRINTGTNLQYKRFFRESYWVYESAADKHIKQLHDDLVAKSWQPKYATRLYLPKPSGLQRPLSLLGIEDQILLQAIANLFAKKLYSKRQGVELKTVFSNKLSEPKDSIFFMDSWQKTYRFFQKRCIEVFDEGYVWSAHFDLSAFYDTISHDLLLSIESPRGGDTDTREVVKEWLQTWSAEDEKTMTGHGIPQGPIASNFLAEAFLLPIDVRLQKEEFQYLRYVDDIRLFGRTEGEVRQAAIILEQECRDRGLIPQSTKFEIRKIKSSEDAMGALPSISPTDNRDVSEPIMTSEEAISILYTSIGGKPKKVTDKARFRYVMYRAPQDTKFLNIVLKLMPRYPEHIDAFVAYFENFATRRSIAKAALDYLETDIPYTYVRGELWHVIARLAGRKELQRGLPKAREDARDRSRCVALSWGVMHFLMRCEKEGLLLLGRRLETEHPLSRSLLAPIFSDRELFEKGHAVTLLKGELMEQLAGARELQKRHITFNELGLPQKDLPLSCRTTLLSLGVIRRRHKSDKDYIGEKLEKNYNCLRLLVWRKLLGSEYEHALQILIEVEAQFPGNPSGWLGAQDSFNDIVVRQFLGFLKSKNLNGHSKVVGKNGQLIVYGSLIRTGTPFDNAYPSEAKVFRTLHERRNKLPGSHPYDQKGGAKNKWLSKKEQASLIPKLKIVLDGIAKVVEQNS
ncbi:hypothetical protein F4Z99_03340, partial [Candidatus Poribacteria bacterium]|nr:hypothetical protein [Candidatus Poribacteria bacterium]